MPLAERTKPKDNEVDPDEGVCVWLPLRAFYLSVVTMTTLGFGDINANPGSAWGHWLLILQVLLGYVLLGVLVTRFAILLTAGGPAANYLMKNTWSMPEELRKRLQAIKYEWGPNKTRWPPLTP